MRSGAVTLTPTDAVGHNGGLVSRVTQNRCAGVRTRARPRPAAGTGRAGRRAAGPRTQLGAAARRAVLHLGRRARAARRGARRTHAVRGGLRGRRVRRRSRAARPRAAGLGGHARAERPAGQGARAAADAVRERRLQRHRRCSRAGDRRHALPEHRAARGRHPARARHRGQPASAVRARADRSRSGEPAARGQRASATGSCEPARSACARVAAARRRITRATIRAQHALGIVELWFRRGGSGRLRAAARPRSRRLGIRVDHASRSHPKASPPATWLQTTPSPAWWAARAFTRGWPDPCTCGLRSWSRCRSISAVTRSRPTTGRSPPCSGSRSSPRAPSSASASRSERDRSCSGLRVR